MTSKQHKKLDIWYRMTKSGSTETAESVIAIPMKSEWADDIFKYQGASKYVTKRKGFRNISDLLTDLAVIQGYNCAIFVCAAPLLGEEVQLI